jgi:hypothetical protein
VTQAEKAAKKCLKPDDWLLDRMRKNSLSCGARICAGSENGSAHDASSYVSDPRGAAHLYAAQCMPKWRCRLHR